MTQADKDIKETPKIAVVEITVDGKVVYSKAVFVEEIRHLEDDVDNALFYYDEAK